MAAGKYTGMVLLDLMKAFDTVDHEILCNKLQAMSIHFDSVKWFKDPLSWWEAKFLCILIFCIFTIPWLYINIGFKK